MVSKHKTPLRYFAPLVLVAIAIGSIILEPSSPEYWRTITLGVLCVGLFSFSVLYMHSRNPLVSDRVALNITQPLVLYSGLVTALFYQGILKFKASVVCVLALFMIIMFCTVVVEISGINHSDITINS